MQLKLKSGVRNGSAISTSISADSLIFASSAGFADARSKGRNGPGQSRIVDWITDAVFKSPTAVIADRQSECRVHPLP